MTEEQIEELFELTQNQEKAFRALKEAFARCRKSGLTLYNGYGTLGCFDKRKIKEYTFRDDTSEDFISAFDADRFTNTFNMGINEFCDDKGMHCFVPTKNPGNGQI